jgi:hypothetical protein
MDMPRDALIPRNDSTLSLWKDAVRNIGKSPLRDFILVVLIASAGAIAFVLIYESFTLNHFRN